MKTPLRLIIFTFLFFAPPICNATIDIIVGVGGDGNDPPERDGHVSFQYPGVNNLVFYHPTQLGSTGVQLRWPNQDTASNGSVYCTSHPTSTGGPITIRNKMVDSGLIFGGHKLFKTSVPGLYYTLKISKIWTAWSTVSDVSEIFIGDSPTEVFHFRISDADLRSTCNKLNDRRHPEFFKIGGVVQDFTVEFYTDATFNPATSQRITLLSNDNYLYSFRAENSGSTVLGYSGNIFFDFNLSNVTLSLPTCYSSVVTGKTVQGSTIALGSYTIDQVKNGATPVPFQIALQNCVRVRNIETKMTSTTIGQQNKKLIANTLQGNGVAQGVGVLIEGLKNSVNEKMVLEPNVGTSIYKAYESESDTTGGIYPGKGQGTTQPLEFQATLQQDGNAAIKAGDFEATGSFQITYP